VGAVLGVPALALGCLALYGAFVVPREHEAGVEIVLEAAPDEVFATIGDFEGYPCWRTGVERVELVEGGFIEHGGDSSMRYVVEERVGGERLVVRIADEALPFGGTWTYEIMPEEPGTRLRITERGHIDGAFLRAGASFFMDMTAGMRLVQADLAEKGPECRAGPQGSDASNK
jgi:hypothetical protein